MPSAEQWQWDSFGLIDQDLNRILWADLNNNLLTFRDRPDVKALLAVVPDMRDACEAVVTLFGNGNYRALGDLDLGELWRLEIAIAVAMNACQCAIAKAKPNLDD